MLSASCQKKEYVLEVDRPVINLEASGNDPEEVVVTAKNVEWSVNIDAASSEWLRAGTTGDRIFITADDRTVEAPRIGRIVVRAAGDVVSAREIVVTQKGATGLTYGLAVTPKTLLFAAGETAESKKVFVTAENTAWSAEVEEPARGWLLITVAQDEIAVKVKEKTNLGSRTGRIVVRSEREELASQYVTVTQTGVNVMFSVSPGELAFGAEEQGSKMITVTAENVGWSSSVEESARQWLKISTAGNIINVSVEPNSDDKPRVGKVIVTPDMEGIARKEVVVTQNSVAGQYDVVFLRGEGQYFGNYYENGCGNFDLRLVSGDLTIMSTGIAKGNNGYFLFCENFSDLAAAGDPHMTAGEYDIVDTMEKYTTLPGYFDEDKEKYMSAMVYQFEEGRITSINSIVSGDIDLRSEGGSYTIVFSVKLDDGTEKSFYYEGSLAFEDMTQATAVSGAGPAGIKSGMQK